MNKIVFLLCLLSCLTTQASLVEVRDNASKNRFLGLDISTCKAETHNTAKNYQKAYNCGNSAISDYLNINFLDPQFLGQQLYLYNDFMYWMGNHYAMGQWNGKDAAAAKKAAKSQAQPDKYFSGSGVFMVEIGTSSYLQKIVAPDKKCPNGKTLVVAQLKYNDGNSIASWSQDSLCLSPEDSFALEINKDQDNSVPSAKANKKTVDAQGVDWMKDAGPSENYTQAGDSPRKIRLVLR